MSHKQTNVMTKTQHGSNPIQSEESLPTHQMETRENNRVVVDL